MATALPIKIAPAVLTWARQSVGYMQEEAAHKGSFKEHQIRDWETGKGSPTYNQLETLAYSVYKRPLALFFRTAPPVGPFIWQDFQTLKEWKLSNCLIVLATKTMYTVEYDPNLSA